MCWTGHSKHKWIATKDIPCKKVIGHDQYDKMHGKNIYIPWLMRHLPFFYMIGHTYEASLNVVQRRPLAASKTDCWIAIDAGLHCYSDDLKVYKHHDYSIIVGNNLFTGDQHTLRPVLVDCIIPRGATYYENERGEMVTNKLKLIRIHEFTDEETDSHTDKET